MAVPTLALRRQLRDFAVAATIALAIAIAAFVGVRNRELAAHQQALAERAAEAIAANRPAIGPVHGALVSPPTVSVHHPYLSHRNVRDTTAATWQPLTDKTLYDAANRFARDGAFVELAPDNSGRAIAAYAASGGSVAIAITEPATLPSFPWLVMIGVVGLGAAIAAAGVMLGERPARVATFAAVATLAIPTLLSDSPVAAFAIALVALAAALAQRAQLTDRVANALLHHRVAMSFLAPAAIAMLLLVAAPFVIGLCLGFYDHHQGTWTFVGLSNFVEILSGGGRSLDDPLNFWFILGVTVLWTAANVTLHVTIGVALALVLSRTWLRGRGVFRMLFILPWAIPNYITALMWKGMFDGNYGAINSVLHHFGIQPVSWFSQWSTSFTADVVTNTWLGFPFMMVVALGALETIPRELYEAASVDGANALQRFWHITLPHLRPALGPAVALGSIWTFNMFNVMYLVSGGKPGDSTNILVTDAYRWAFERGDRYGMAAAEGTIIFAILLLWTVLGSRVTRKEAA
jgi:ABC-type sugar transport system permease subunit